MIKSLIEFFKEREYRTVRFGELDLIANGREEFRILVLFQENNKGNRRYIVKGKYISSFCQLDAYLECETWKETDLFPEWAKDPVAEKLGR